MKITQAVRYIATKNKRNELVFFLNPMETFSKSPYVLYAEGDHALLFRDDENLVILDYIHPSIRNEMKQKEYLKFIEIDDDGGIKFEYSAKLIISDKLIIEKDKIFELTDIDYGKLKKLDKMIEGNPKDKDAIGEEVNRIIKTSL